MGATYLSDDQKATQIKCSRSVLTILLAHDTRAWHHTVTLDEFWFHYIIVHELIWLPPDGKVPDRERVTIQSKQGMLTIVRRPTGFAVVTALKSRAISTRASM
jgi:predicted cupin superfamily sugar epimerase